MTVPAIVFAVAALVALYFLIRTFHCLRHRRIVRAGACSISCVIFAAIAGLAFVIAFSYYGYERLVAEQRVASIEFRRTGADEYEARLMMPDSRDRFFTLRGDEWQIDARLVIWKPPATILGLDPIYRLERLSGRYSEIGREQTEHRTVHSLSTPQAVDVWTIAREHPMFTPGVDAQYGSATFVPMTDGARFDVSLTRDAIIARAANQAAREAVGNWQN